MDRSLNTVAGVSGVDRLTLEDPMAAVGGANSAPGVDFAKLVDGQLSQVDADIRVAEQSMRDLAEGKPVELHELMINLERARMSVQVFVQVRNKLVESYQDLMRMQM